MEYYLLRYSLDRKIIGSDLPQLEGVYLTSVESPDFIGNTSVPNGEVSKTVERPLAKLRKKSTKLTDLMSVVGVGFLNNFLLSNRLKQIIEHSKNAGVQFFDTSVFSFNGDNPYLYWILNNHLSFPEYVDYKKSELWIRTVDGNGEEQVYCDSYEDYQRKKNLYAPRDMIFKRVEFIEEKVEYDFFALDNVYGSIAFYVSKNLKKFIEAEHCTGVEFIKSNESYL